MGTLFADALSRFSEAGETGALFVTVVQSRDSLVRIWFEAGSIRRVSYGPLHGRECLELLDRYDLEYAIFFPGMRTMRPPDDGIPDTDSLISALRSTGRMVQEVHVSRAVHRQDRPAVAA